MSAIVVGSFSLASHTAGGIFSGLSQSLGRYEAHAQEPTAGGVLWVNSPSDTTGIGLTSSAGNQLVLNVDNSEIYLYNNTGSAVTIEVALVPRDTALSNPVSATFNY